MQTGDRGSNPSKSMPKFINYFFFNFCYMLLNATVGLSRLNDIFFKYESNQSLIHMWST